MDYISISIHHYIKSHFEQQGEITLIELGPSPYCFVKSIFLHIIIKFDEIPPMTLQDIREKTIWTDHIQIP